MDLNDAFSLSDHIQNLDYLYSRALEKAKQLPEHIPFLEIGTRAGGSALAFLFAIKESSRKKRPLFTVDPYGNKPYLRGSEVLNMDYGERFYRTAMRYLSQYSFDNNLFHHHWRLTSKDYMLIRTQIDFWYDGQLLENHYGFVYLDGDHEEKTIESEITYFSTRLCDGGLLVIDDSEHIIHSTNEIIQEFLQKAESNGNRLYWEKS